MPEREIRYRDLHRSTLERLVREVSDTAVKVGVQGKSALARKDVRTAPSRRRGSTRGKRRSRILRSAGRLRVVDIATIHEFGSPKARIPERSYLRSAIRDNRTKLQQLQKEVWRAVLRGKDHDRQLRRLALFAESRVKRQIVELREPPLRPSTKRRRFQLTGDLDPNPLVDTSQLKNSIVGVVQRGKS